MFASGETVYARLLMHRNSFGLPVLAHLAIAGVLAGKAICLSSLLYALGERKWTVWLCAALLCATMPRMLWQAVGESPLLVVGYVACAVGAAFYCQMFLFGGKGLRTNAPAAAADA